VIGNLFREPKGMANNKIPYNIIFLIPLGLHAGLISVFATIESVYYCESVESLIAIDLKMPTIFDDIQCL
jgi:hypothetical protein